MLNYTLTYSEPAKGWVSFYSYQPEWMIGMNNYFYTFKGGNLYRHNVNENRNTFYQDWWTRVGDTNGAFSPSTLQSVFNQSPIENKLFKTISLEGDAKWDVQLSTDIQVSGFINSSWFEKKEASFFAFIRNNSVGEFNLRSLNGIGNSLTVTGGGTNNATINFSISPLVSIGSIVSIGDFVYFGHPAPNFGGRVKNIIVDLPNGINRIVIDNNMTVPLSIPMTNNVNFIFFVKNSIAESHGVLGHYCTFNMQNFSTEKIELFVVRSEVMKSYP